MSSRTLRIALFACHGFALAGLALGIYQGFRLQFGLWFWLGALSFVFFTMRSPRIEHRIKMREIEERHKRKEQAPTADSPVENGGNPEAPTNA